MQIDLERHEVEAEPVRSQVCIVGAGIAGLTLAHRLSALGMDVVLLEAGGQTIDENSQSVFAGAQLAGHPHLGTTEGRFRVLGGSSLRWGGQLLPLSSEPDPAWPITAADLAPFHAEAERLLGVDDLPFTAAEFFPAIRKELPPLLAELPELTALISKWTPFGRRNFTQTIGRELLAKGTVRIYIHAQVVELVLAASRSRVIAALVRTRGGAMVRFEADHFIVAAGTVETVRLLLASHSIAPDGLGNGSGQVGRNFHDHLALPAATVTGAARARLLHELRPWIRGATVHSIKLEPTPRLRAELKINVVVAQLTLEEFDGSGLAVVREVLTALQHGNVRAALATHAAHLPAAVLDAFRLAGSALWQRRRFVSPSTSIKLHLNAAQEMPSRSRITLSTELDAFGMQKAVVDWRVLPHELATLSLFAQYLSKHLPAKGIQWLPGIFSTDEPARGLMLSRIQDSRHPMGGACMGRDPRSSVVDADLTVHGVDNLSLASAATFPNGSPALPTFPLMALSLRLAERVAARLPSQPRA